MYPRFPTTRVPVAFLTILAVLTPALGAGPPTITVGPTGRDFTSVQEAIDAASPGTTIEIDAGNYPESLDLCRMGMYGAGPGDLTMRGVGGSRPIIAPTSGPGFGYSSATGFPGTLVIEDLDFNGGELLLDGFNSDATVSRVGVTNSPGNGILVQNNNAGTLAFSDISINNPSAASFNGGFHFFNNTGGSSIHVTNSTVSTGGGYGIRANQNASLSLNSASSVTATNGPAVDIRNTVGTIGLTDVFSTNSPAGGGLWLDNYSGSFMVSGSTTVDNARGPGIGVKNSPGASFDFGNTTVSNSGTGSENGIDLFGSTGATFTFDSLSVSTSSGGGTGVSVDGAGTVNLGGTSNTITSTGGPAVKVRDSSLGSGWTFSTVGSSGSSVGGIGLENTTGDFNVTGAANVGVGTPGVDGILLSNNAGQFSFGTVAIVLTGGRGLFVDNGGTVNVAGGVIDNQAGIGLDISGTTVGLIIDSFSSRGSTGSGVKFRNVMGSFELHGGSITGSSGPAFEVDGGSVKSTFRGSTLVATDTPVVSIVNTTGGTTTFDNSSLSHSGSGVGLLHNGDGTLILTDTCTYSGTTAVQKGTLVVNGTGSSGNQTLVSGTGTLDGRGDWQGTTTVTSGGTLEVGNGVGILRTGDTILNQGADFSVEITGTTPGSGHDQLDVTGTVDLGGAILDVNMPYSPSQGDAFKLINNDGTDPVAGTFLGLPEGALIRRSNTTFQTTYQGGDGNDVVLGVPQTAVEHDAFSMTWGTMDLVGPGQHHERVLLRGATNVDVLFEGPNEGNAYDDNGNDRDEVRTEIVSMDLHGVSTLGDLAVRLDPRHRSLGAIEETQNPYPSELDLLPFGLGNEFPAESFFDIYFEIEVGTGAAGGGTRFYPADPRHLQAMITHKPPTQGETYGDDTFTPLLDEQGNLTGWQAGRFRYTPNPLPDKVERDSFPQTRATMGLLLNPTDPLVPLVLHGPTEVHVLFPGDREGDAFDLDGDGREQVDTEIVSMSLTGRSPFGDVQLGLDPAVPSLGEIEESLNNTLGRLDLLPFVGNAAQPPVPTATSFFDVTLLLSLNRAQFIPDRPAHMEALIRHKPPSKGNAYKDSGSLVVRDSQGNPKGALVDLALTPDPVAYTVEQDPLQDARSVLGIRRRGGSPRLVSLRGPGRLNVLFEGPEQGNARDDDGDGQGEVVTFLESLQQTTVPGTVDPVSLAIIPERPGAGMIEERENVRAGWLDLPPFAQSGTADSYYYVTPLIDLGDGPLVPERPMLLQTVVGAKPAAEGDTFRLSEPVALTRPDGTPTDMVVDRFDFIPYPPPDGVERDEFPNTRALVDLQLGNGPAVPVVLNGPTTVEVPFEGAREGDAFDNDSNGLDEVATEMVQMRLSGNSQAGPVRINLDPAHPSLGLIEETRNQTPGRLDVRPLEDGDFRVDSFFDLFFVLEVGPVGGAQVLHPRRPAHMVSQNRRKPPAPGEVFVDPGSIELVDGQGRPVGQLTNLRHIPVPLPDHVEDDLFPNARLDVGIQRADGTSRRRVFAGPLGLRTLFEGPNEGDAYDNDFDGLDEVTVQINGRMVSPADPSAGKSELILFVNPSLLPGPGQEGANSRAVDLQVLTEARIVEVENHIPGRLELDPFVPGRNADSFFDVFFELEIGDTKLHSQRAANLRGMLNHKPPGRDDVLASNEEVELFHSDGTASGVSLQPLRLIPDPSPDFVQRDAFAHARGEMIYELPDGTVDSVVTRGSSVLNVFFEGPNAGDAFDHDRDRRDEVDTELVEFALQGTTSAGEPVRMGLAADRRALGTIEEVTNLVPGRFDLSPFSQPQERTSAEGEVLFPFWAELRGQRLHPAQTPRLRGRATHKPVAPGETLSSDRTTQLLLDDGSPTGITMRQFWYTPDPLPAGAAAEVSLSTPGNTVEAGGKALVTLTVTDSNGRPIPDLVPDVLPLWSSNHHPEITWVPVHFANIASWTNPVHPGATWLIADPSGIPRSRQTQPPSTNAMGEVHILLENVPLGTSVITATVDGLPPAKLEITGAFQLLLRQGLNLFTIPLDLSQVKPTPPMPPEVLGIHPDHLRLAAYSAAQEDYVLYSQQAFPFVLGMGYFGQFDTDRVVSLSEGAPADPSQPFAITYPSRGWHLFGSPRLTDLLWRLDEIKAIRRGEPDGFLAPTVQGPAVLARAVEPYGWVYNAETPADPVRLLYDPRALATVPQALRSRVVDRLKPGQGFFGMTNAPDSGFLFPAAPVEGGRAAAAEAPSAEPVEGEWSVELIAQCGEATDGANVFGARPPTADAFQLAEPPLMDRSDGTYLSLAFVPAPEESRLRTGTDAPALLSVDVRPEASPNAQWEAIVRTNSTDAPVTLSWPDLSYLPSHYRPYLVDTETGRRQAMRTTTSYRFHSRADGPTDRRFRIEVDASGNSRLQITGVAVVPNSRGGGMSVAYTLSQPANVQLSLRNAAGRSVYTVGPRQSSAGANAVSLTGRSAAGQPLARGMYMLELIAEADTGERFRVIRPVGLR